MTKVPDNELRVDLLASVGVNPWAQHDSAPRVQMLAGHLSQALVIAGASPRRCQTGIERQFGRFTFNIKMPANAEIIRVYEQYPRTIDRNAIRENPRTAVIYEDIETKEVGILMIPRYHCKHQHFGFRYKFKPQAMSRLIPGDHIAKGTILADSPAVDDMGNYSLGLETEVALMSIPGIIEDGVVISESYARKLTTKGFESRVASWGTKYYPLNLYGTDEEYKPFPDIGDTIREDGLLFALRPYDPLLAPIEMTPKALREPDHTFDKLIYAEKGARVIDVSVRHEVKNGPPPTPIGMEVQTQRYYAAQLKFYRNIIELYNDLRRRRKDSLRITPEFHRTLVEALIYCQEPGKNRATQMYQRQPLDDWRVEVTFEYDVLPTTGFKLTDLHGGKGVVCDVWKDEEMPVDMEGNRADCVMDGEATIKRMNLGRLYEQCINATSRHVTNQVRLWMSEMTNESIAMAWAYVLGYYKIVSPRMYDLITGPSYTEQPRGHLEAIVKHGVYLYLPTDNPAYSPDIIEQLRVSYPINIGPVQYRGRSGRYVTTVSPVLIGSLYVILLEKTDGDWSAVSSARLQHFGIPARMTKNDKYSLPGRANPVRVTGESEDRLLVAVIGGEATAEILEMSNSPALHQSIVAKILEADQPTNIPLIIDRSVAPKGGSRSRLYVDHALQCAGIELYYVPDNETVPVIYRPDPDAILDVSRRRRRPAVTADDVEPLESVESDD